MPDPSGLERHWTENAIPDAEKSLQVIAVSKVPWVIYLYDLRRAGTGDFDD
jgi:hypothetical protein